MNAETEQERGRRRHQRTLFDGVAGLYADSRGGYPAELVDFVVTTAGLRAGCTVLEVGCGPGQSWPADVRQSFTGELRHYLRSQPEVPLTQQTSLTMARVLPPSERMYEP